MYRPFPGVVGCWASCCLGLDPMMRTLPIATPVPSRKITIFQGDKKFPGARSGQKVPDRRVRGGGAGATEPGKTANRPKTTDFFRCGSKGNGRAANRVRMTRSGSGSLPWPWPHALPSPTEGRRHSRPFPFAPNMLPHRGTTMHRPPAAARAATHPFRPE